MQLPRKPHLDAVRRTLRYVRATLDHALFYAADVPVELHGYTDTDWAGSAIDQRSTSGFMFTLGSATITWSSKKQPTVALSSTEVEYRGAAVGLVTQATYGFEAASGHKEEQVAGIFTKALGVEKLRRFAWSPSVGVELEGECLDVELSMSWHSWYEELDLLHVDRDVTDVLEDQGKVQTYMLDVDCVEKSRPTDENIQKKCVCFMAHEEESQIVASSKAIKEVCASWVKGMLVSIAVQWVILQIQVSLEEISTLHGWEGGSAVFVEQNPLESIDASVSELGDASHGSGNVDVSKVGSADVSVSSHKGKLSKTQGSLAKAWDHQARKEATMAVRRFFYAEDVPFWKVRSPYFLDMISAVGKDVEAALDMRASKSDVAGTSSLGDHDMDDDLSDVNAMDDDEEEDEDEDDDADDESDEEGECSISENDEHDE
ncbi:hypothetical protein L7F22_012831 [Adiantum nelumboides]|nr:hypothetical protein [Adiantum nelumboides]